jgi:hypothetical protein
MYKHTSEPTPKVEHLIWRIFTLQHVSSPCSMSVHLAACTYTLRFTMFTLQNARNAAQRDSSYDKKGVYQLVFTVLLRNLSLMLMFMEHCVMQWS